MTIRWVIWKDQFVEKIARKHGIESAEVDQVLRSKPRFRKAQKGRVPGQDLYVAYGRTDAGRHVAVFFVLKRPDSALPISARDMTTSERRKYGKRE